MSGSAFGATLALLIAAALLVADTFKNVVLEYGAFQAGRFIQLVFFPVRVYGQGGITDLCHH